MDIQIKLQSRQQLSQQEIAQIKRVANMLMQHGHMVNITWPDQSTNSNPYGNIYIRDKTKVA
jgi:hypothetical protein